MRRPVRSAASPPEAPPRPPRPFGRESIPRCEGSIRGLWDPHGFRTTGVALLANTGTVPPSINRYAWFSVTANGSATGGRLNVATALPDGSSVEDEFAMIRFGFEIVKLR